MIFKGYCYSSWCIILVIGFELVSFAGSFANDVFDIVPQDNGKVFLEADNAKYTPSNIRADGKVVIKNNSAIVNSEVVLLSAISVLDNKINLLELPLHAKIRQKEGDFIYAKSMFYDNKTGYGVAREVQFFPGSLVSTEIVADSVSKNKQVINFYNAIFSLCLFEDDNLHAMREKNFDTLTNKEREAIPTPTKSNVINNEYNDVRLRHYFSSISLRTPHSTYNIDTKTTTLYHNILSIFGIPVFYIPYLSMKSGNNGGESGLLMPKFVVLGTQQAGIEIPVHINLRPDTDFTFTRTQYFPLWSKMSPSPVANTDHSYLLSDLIRQRESINSLQFRHLLSDRFNFQSFIFFEGDLTDKTILVDNVNSRGAIDQNGNLLYGYRGYFNINSKARLTKTTFFDVNWMYSSDRNYMYFYHLDYRQSKINNISLYDIDEKRNISLDLIQFQPFTMQFDGGVTPVLMPVLKADYIFDKDKFGGRLITRNKFNTIERQAGYSHTNLTTDLIYELPYIAKEGYKITFETMLRGQYDNVRFSAYDKMAMTPGQFPLSRYTNNSNIDYFFGNYGALLQNNIYYGTNSAMLGGNYIQVLNFNKLQFEMPFIFASKVGYTTLEPKVAIKYAPNAGRNSFIPNDDLLGIKLDYNNAFSLMQSSGSGMYDTGGSVIYGGDARHKFHNNSTELQAGVAQSMRIIDSNIPIYVLPEYSGYQQSISDVLGNVKISNGFLATGLMYRYDSYRGQFRELNSYIQMANQYIIATLSYTQLARNATIYNRAMELISFYARIMPIKDLELYISGAVNLSTEVSPILKNGYVGLTTLSYGAAYSVACLRFIFGVSENYMQIGNISGIRTYRFTVQFNGIG